jgi:phosphatidylserine decarboxylase
MSRHSPAAAAAQRLIRRPLAGRLCAAGSGLLALWQPSAFPVSMLVAVGVWLLFTGFVLFVFRDPTPVVPQAREAIVSPAHGLVDMVHEMIEPEFVGGPCRRVSVTLSVFDVHVQNAPVAGRVVFVQHQPGKFLNAMRTDSARHNENQLIGLESMEVPGERVAVRQIAGLIARRIVLWVQEGATIARGQRLGLIQFGSRCDLYLPLSTRITVKPGDKVAGGETMVATRTSPGSLPVHASARSGSVLKS